MNPLGGIIHTYQKYDPVELPGPTSEPPDLVTPAMEHLLTFGSTRELTEDELADAIHLDPSQIANLGPSIESLRALLEERKRRILEKYEAEKVRDAARKAFERQSRQVRPPSRLAKRYQAAIRDEQIYELENLWYAAEDDRSSFASELMQVIARLGDSYQIEELVAKYAFVGREPMTVPQALEIKKELETIDKLLKQLEEAAKTARIAVIDLDELARLTEPDQVEQLSAMEQQIQSVLRELAERQGIEQGKRGGFELTPKAMRAFQSRILTAIYEQLQASRTGRHEQAISGEGAVESPKTKPFEFGDSLTQLDLTASMTNALIRSGPGLPIRMRADDLEVHRPQVHPKAATALLLDMSGSMRYGGVYVDVKRMAIAMEGLIRSEYPGDFLQCIEMYSFGKLRASSDLPYLMPKPVTVFQPIVRRKYDMSQPDVSESAIPPHFTNIQHALRLARQVLSRQDTPNRQIVLITDGLPTAHFEESLLYLLYPPDIRTEQATLREGLLCAQAGITINVFLLASWNQTEDDVRFAKRLAESTRGRVVFVGGKELDRFVVWDYLKRKKSVVA